MSAEKPWSMRHTGVLLIGIFLPFLLLLLFYVAAPLFASLPIPFGLRMLIMPVSLVASLLVSIMCMHLHASGTMFNKILNALRREVISFEISGSRFPPPLMFGTFFRTLTCETSNGKISLMYFHRVGWKIGFRTYYLWITVAKPLPAKERIYKRKAGLLREYPEVSEFFRDKLPNGKTLMAIKSLGSITAESENGENRLVARFGPFSLRVKASDIIKCLGILRNLEKKL